MTSRVAAVQPVEVERQQVRVMYMRAPEDTPFAIQNAWAKFERVVGLKGRKFYGTFDVGTREYRVCTELQPGDDPERLGLEVAILPGGKYLRARLQGDPPAVYRKIPVTFQQLVKTSTSDPSRPSIEFYRSRDVIDLLLPVI